MAGRFLGLAPDGTGYVHLGAVDATSSQRGKASPVEDSSRKNFIRLRPWMEPSTVSAASFSEMDVERCSRAARFHQWP